MNRTSSGSSDRQCSSNAASHPSHLRPLPLSKALNGFAITKLAKGLSARTVDSYVDLAENPIRPTVSLDWTCTIIY